MMNAGLDCGASLIKAAWKVNETIKFCSGADGKFLLEIAELMKTDGITKVHLAGMCGSGYEVAINSLSLQPVKSEGDLIDTEINLQAKGVAKLLNTENKLLDSYVIISIGSGTSYTFVDREAGIRRFPIGNSTSGGSLIGDLHNLGILSYNQFSELASRGNSQDLKVGDVIPGHPLSEFLIANKGRVSPFSRLEDKVASCVNQVSSSTIQHLLMINGWPGWEVPNDLIYIGTTVARTPKLRESLTKYSAMLGKTPYFLDKGEYALAVGAMLTNL